MDFEALASSSFGNLYLARSEGTALLLEAGLPLRSITRR